MGRGLTLLETADVKLWLAINVFLAELIQSQLSGKSSSIRYDSVLWTVVPTLLQAPSFRALTYISRASRWRNPLLGVHIGEVDYRAPQLSTGICAVFPNDCFCFCYWAFLCFHGFVTYQDIRCGFWVPHTNLLSYLFSTSVDPPFVLFLFRWGGRRIIFAF